jgi:EmrB/QacA subfamily drug resistance transporter
MIGTTSVDQQQAKPGQAQTERGAGPALALLVAGTFFMENLDASVIGPAIPQMARDFERAPIDLNTGISAYMLTLGILIPVSGWLADKVGPRRIFCGAILLFTFASLLCGLATGLPEFVMARILQGIGGAMMVPVGRLVVLRSTPKEKLVSAIATLTWPALVAPVLGPPIGGLIADHADWRFIFYLNLPLGLIALATAWKIVPDERSETVGAFDWLGFVLSSFALTALLFAAEIASRPGANLLLALVLAVAGAILLFASFRHFGRAKAPMIELSSVRIPTYAVAIFGGSMFRMGVSAVPFLVPLMFQVAFGYSAFDAGAMLMAVFGGNLLMKPMTTPILRRFGFRPVLIVNGILNAVLIAACALMVPGMPLTLISFILFLGGMTRSMHFTALNTIAFADVPQAKMRSANTLFSAVFQLAVGLGVALGAMAWRAGEALFPNGSAATPFHVAFLVIAIVSLMTVIDSARLAPKAGEHVSKGKKASATTSGGSVAATASSK